MSTQPDYLTEFSQFMHEISLGTEFNASNFGGLFVYNNLKNLLVAISQLNWHRSQLLNYMKAPSCNNCNDIEIPDNRILQEQLEQNIKGMKYYYRITCELFISNCTKPLIKQLSDRYMQRMSERLSSQ